MSSYDSTGRKRYESSFTGFLDGFAKKKSKYATQDDEVIAMVEKSMTRLANRYKVEIVKKDIEIESLKKSLKKIRKQMRESASITYATGPKRGIIKLGGR